MTNETLFSNILSVTGTLLEAAVVVRILMSNMRRELPLFLAYAAYSAVQDVILLIVHNYFGLRSIPYFLTYWALFAGETILFFFVIHEVYAQALYHYEGLRKLSGILFRWAFMVLTVVAAIITLASPAADAKLYGSTIMLSRCAMIVEFGLIVLLFVFAKSLAIGWKECIFGIAVGICFMCSIELVSLTLRVEYGRDLAEMYSFAKPATWVATTAVWAFYVFRSEHARENIVTLRNPELDEWNNAVLQFLNR